MPHITALEPQRRRGRLNVFIDGIFVLGVGEKTAAELGLRIGREITPERLTEVATLEEINKALDAALSLLETRPRSATEVRRRLREKGYADAVADPVLEKLRRLELIDDAAFAAQWVEARSRPTGARPMGKRRLSMELLQKGVAQETVQEAVESVSAEKESDLALAAARKKFKAWPENSEARRAEQAKLISFLQRRGFGWDAIKATLAALAPLDEDDAIEEQE